MKIRSCEVTVEVTLEELREWLSTVLPPQTGALQEVDIVDCDRGPVRFVFSLDAAVSEE